MDKDTKIDEQSSFKCKECQKDFSLTPGEVEFFTHSTSDEGKPMVLPKRCSACRRKKRDNQQRI